MRVSHVAFYFSLRDQSRNAVNYDRIYRSAPDELFCDVQSLFRAVRLSNEKRV